MRKLFTCAAILTTFALASAMPRTAKQAAKKSVARKKNLRTKELTPKAFTVLEKKRSALINKYKQRSKHAQALRKQNKSLIASISQLEGELATATIRQQALQA